MTAAFETELMQELRSRQPRGLPQRDSLVAWATGLLFVAAAVSLALWAGSLPSVWVAALMIGTYAVVSRVGFEVVSGHAVPTELVFVPMLFVLPPAIVPLCVAAGLVVGQAPELVRGRMHVNRLPLLVGSAAHALGPATVLVLAGPAPPTLHSWPLYVAALAAQFATDFAATMPWARWSYGIAPRAHLLQMRWLFCVDAALAPIGLVIAVLAVQSPAAVLLVLPLVGLLALFARERQVRIDHAVELSKAYRGTALLLSDVIEADDEYTGQHSCDVVDLVLLVADQLGLDPSARRDAEFAALLHDVGKMKMPAEIINKPGPLSPAEYDVIKMHTIEGERMLEQIGGLLGAVGRIVRSCHERWDGTGYPDRLAGETIPLAARIVMACDAFSAMTTDRSYRRAMSEPAAIDELVRCRGTQFDPRVVDALLVGLERRPTLQDGTRLSDQDASPELTAAARDLVSAA
jgi:putative nucleotidyltransferase with HDIG domain